MPKNKRELLKIQHFSPSPPPAGPVCFHSNTIRSYKQDDIKRTALQGPTYDRPAGFLPTGLAQTLNRLPLSCLPPRFLSFLLSPLSSRLFLLFPVVQGFTNSPLFLYYSKKGEEEQRKKVSPKRYPNAAAHIFSREPIPPVPSFSCFKTLPQIDLWEHQVAPLKAT